MPEIPTLTPSAESCREYVAELAKLIGPGFHPDTGAANYFADAACEQRTFTDEQASQIDRDMATAFAVLGDGVYEVALGVFQNN